MAIIPSFSRSRFLTNQPSFYFRHLFRTLVHIHPSHPNDLVSGSDWETLRKTSCYTCLCSKPRIFSCRAFLMRLGSRGSPLTSMPSMDLHNLLLLTWVSHVGQSHQVRQHLSLSMNLLREHTVHEGVTEIQLTVNKATLVNQLIYGLTIRKDLQQVRVERQIFFLTISSDSENSTTKLKDAASNLGLDL